MLKYISLELGEIVNSLFSESVPTILSAQLTICTLISSEDVAQRLSQVLSCDRYVLHIAGSTSEFFELIERKKQHLDCLVVQEDNCLTAIINHLYEGGTLLPVVVLESNSRESAADSYPVVNRQEFVDLPQETPAQRSELFHAVEVRLDINQLVELQDSIEHAIERFLALSPVHSLPEPSTGVDLKAELSNRSFLMQQQRRLSEKLQERLGYLGVYYKRNPQLFLRHLPQQERQKLLEKLKSEYRQIILNYFSQDETLNQRIDNFVNQAFFADISVSRIVEIHMDLMDEFSKQLQLEGRRDDILLDYRLTLIDVIAHLGEMYRRSIPREL